MDVINIKKVVRVNPQLYVVFGKVAANQICENDPVVVNESIPAQVASIALLNPRLKLSQQTLTSSAKRVAMAHKEQQVAVAIQLPQSNAEYNIKKVECAYPLMTKMLYNEIRTRTLNTE